MRKHPPLHPYLSWLPNALTLLRVILALYLPVAALRHAWDVAAIGLIAALLSDFFDGLAAKKLHAYSRFGRILDPVADCLLSACGVLSLVLTGYLSWWFVVAGALSAAVIGYVKFFRSDRPRLQHLMQTASVPYLFIVWLLLGMTFISLAWGWHVVYVPLALSLLLGAGLLKRHRLRAWYGWLFTR